MDCNLSVSRIADNFGISRQSVFNIFKRHSTVSAVDYITKIRIDKAIQYLEETRYSNEKIANLVGFGSNVTFVRSFKKFEGTTPKKYRESRQK